MSDKFLILVQLMFAIWRFWEGDYKTSAFCFVMCIVFQLLTIDDRIKRYIDLKKGVN